MSSTDSSELPKIDTGLLRPYASGLILECTSSDPAQAFDSLRMKLNQMKITVRGRRASALVASGLMQVSQFVRSQQGSDQNMLDEIDGFIHRSVAPQSWAKSDNAYSDLYHELTLFMRRERLLVIHADDRLKAAVQRWLDRQPSAPFRRIRPGVLHAAFVKGEAKGLWLRGTHSRRTTKPDTKTISGSRLQDALSPFDDSSFALGAARAELPEEESTDSLYGNIGTTPRKSQVWLRPTDDFHDFVMVFIDLLTLLDKTLASGVMLDRPFPWLAAEVTDLASVQRAYELTVLPPDLLGPSSSDDTREAAEILQRAVLNVRGRPNSPNFLIDVGL